MPVLAAADVSNVSTLTTTMTESFTTMINDCMSMIAALVPVVLPLVGAGLVVAYGIKTFRKITAKA